MPLFNYTTKRILLTDSYALGILYRFLQLLIIAYFVTFPLIIEKRYQTTVTYPMNMSTRIIGNQVLHTNHDTIYSISANDITSPDMVQNDIFNFGIRVRQNWQRRTNWFTPTQWVSDDDCGQYLNGAWQSGNCTSFQWCTVQSQSFRVDMLDNFYLEIRGIVCETQEDGDDTEWYDSFGNVAGVDEDDEVLGTRYTSF